MFLQLWYLFRTHSVLGNFNVPNRLDASFYALPGSVESRINIGSFLLMCRFFQPRAPKHSYHTSL